MARALVSGELWAMIEPMIPVKPLRTRRTDRRPDHDITARAVTPA